MGEGADTDPGASRGDDGGVGSLARTTVVAAALGLGGALVTVAFLAVLREIHEALWQDLPDALGIGYGAAAFVIPVCVVGGVLVGVCRHLLGEYPVGLEEALVSFRETRTFDHRHLPQAAVTSFVSLGFGAALGPEAALVSLVGGLSSWISQVIKLNARAASDVEYIGVSGALGALFGSAGVAALAFDEEHATRDPKRALIVIPGLAAAGVGLLVFRFFDSGPGYFDYTFPAYDFAATDLAWALLAVLVGVAVATAYLLLERAFDAAAPLLGPNRVVQSGVGGLLFGLLATTSTLVLFSGHEGVQELLDDPGATVGFLAAIAVAKLTATTLLLATGWKGGRFFPVMFAGAAAGLALAGAVGGVDPMVGLAAAMTVAIAVLIRKPAGAILLMLFLFPVDLWPVVVLGGLLAGVAAQRLERRHPALFEVPEPG